MLLTFLRLFMILIVLFETFYTFLPETLTCSVLFFDYVRTRAKSANIYRDGILRLLLLCSSQFFYGRIFKENQTLLWFKNRPKKAVKQENPSLFVKSIFCRKKRAENQTKLESEKTQFMHRNPDKKCLSRIPSHYLFQLAF
jgi:hypothetical protein